MASGSVKQLGRTLIATADYRGLTIKIYRYMPWLYIFKVGGKTTEALSNAWSAGNVKTGISTPEDLQSANAMFYSDGIGIALRIAGTTLQLAAYGDVPAGKYVNGTVLITP